MQTLKTRYWSEVHDEYFSKFIVVWAKIDIFLIHTFVS